MPVDNRSPYSTFQQLRIAIAYGFIILAAKIWPPIVGEMVATTARAIAELPAADD